MQPARTAVLFLLAVFLFPSSSSSQGRPSMIVSTDWLEKRLDDPDLVILQVSSTRREYMNGHIPGARFLWTGWYAQSNPDMSYELVPLDQLSNTIEELGISSESRIVVVFPNNWVTSGTRMYVTLEYLGLGDRTSFLDGGYETWKAEKKPISKVAPVVKRTSFAPSTRADALVTIDAVIAATKNPAMDIIDARSARFYKGEPAGMSRGGHIPGAKNIAFTDVIDSTNKFLSYDDLKTIFDKAGIRSGSKVITYCHIGQQASLLYFVARYLGHDASLYDGSFEDWSSREDLPVEVPEKKE
jgi:thiosulfate/3-mercaptopyruvate sulfurtransferase